MSAVTWAPAHERLVIGAIGPWDGPVLARAVAHVPVELTERHRSPHAVLLSAAPVEVYGQGRFFWGSLAGHATPTSWQSASEERLAAGLVVEDDSAILHTCALGVQELYTRKIGQTVYFANRIASLVELVEDELHVNWEAWASTIALGSPFGTDTPFREIERLSFAGGLQYRAGLARVSYDPAFLNVVPRRGVGAVTPLDVAVTIDAAIPDLAEEELPVNITLSGGWDSRLLAGLVARRRPRNLRSWTASPDDGYDLDLAFARPLAECLGTEHREIVPSPSAWVDNRQEAYRAFEHQTWLHTWFVPVGAAIRESGGPVVDGVAGGIILKGAFISSEALEATTPDGRRRPVLAALTGGRAARDDMYTPSVTRWIDESSRGAVEKLVSRFESQPNELTLLGLLGRTARSICPSSYNLYGGPHRAVLPYLDPRVVAVTLAVPEETKVQRVFNRQVIEVAAGPKVAALRSTNDPGPRPELGARRQASPEALAVLAATTLADPVVSSLLNAEFRAVLEDEERRGQLARWSGPVQILQALSMFAHWRETYSSRLVPESPPWA